MVDFEMNSTKISRTHKGQLRVWLMIKQLFLAVITLLTAAGAISSVHAATFFSFTSSPNAWVGQGQTFNFLSVTATRTGNLGAYTDSVHFSAGGYQLVIVGPNLTLPEVGFYPAATRWPFMGSGPGLDLSGNGRGNNRLTGWFHVLQADYDPSGQPVAFAVDFTQYGEEDVAQWSRGSIRFNSDIPAPGPPPPIRITKLTNTNGVIQLQLTGPAGTNCVLQTASDLGTWLPLKTNAISPVGLLTITNTDAAGAQRRFFRAVR
jgi:hypothetical protein